MLSPQNELRSDPPIVENRSAVLLVNHAPLACCGERQRKLILFPLGRPGGAGLIAGLFCFSTGNRTYGFSILIEIETEAQVALLSTVAGWKRY